jgi:hypothetical protein
MHGTNLDWKIGVVIFTAVVIIYSILILTLTQ